MERSPVGLDSVVLLPCNGLSARGRVVARAAKLVREGMEEVRLVDIVPLLAGLEEETGRVKSARAVVGLSGCAYRCDAKACQRVAGREPDEHVVVGDLLRPDVLDVTEATDEELHECALQVSSRVLGIIGRLV